MKKILAGIFALLLVGTVANAIPNSNDGMSSMKQCPKGLVYDVVKGCIKASVQTM